MREIIAKRIKQLREETRLSKLQFAKKLGVSDSAIHYWENGLRDIKLEYLCKIADTFDVTLDYLVGRTDL